MTKFRASQTIRVRPKYSSLEARMPAIRSRTAVGGEFSDSQMTSQAMTLLNEPFGGRINCKSFTIRLILCTKGRRCSGPRFRANALRPALTPLRTKAGGTKSQTRRIRLGVESSSHGGHPRRSQTGDSYHTQTSTHRSRSSKCHFDAKTPHSPCVALLRIAASASLSERI